jgi:hypothetical protein
LLRAGSPAVLTAGSGSTYGLSTVCGLVEATRPSSSLQRVFPAALEEPLTRASPKPLPWVATVAAAMPIPELSRHRSGGCCPPRGVAPRGEPADRRVQYFCRNSRSQVWQQRMEPLWSPAVATGRNRWQMVRPRERLEQPQTVAAGCDWLPKEAHGKEGVSGSSPEEGLKFLQIGPFVA